MLAEIGRRLDAILFFDLPDDVAIERMLKRAAERGPGRRHARGDRAPARDLPLARPSRSSSTTARPASSSPLHAERPIERGLGRHLRPRSSALETPRDHPQVARARSSAWRAAGAVVAETLALLARARSSPGVTMAELDRDRPRSTSARSGGVPTSKGYKGFPAAICISPNDDDRARDPGRLRAQEGDIISFDVGVTLRRADRRLGRHRSASARSRAEAQRLLDVCQAALEAGIEQAHDRRARRGHLARRADASTEDAGFCVVRSLVGHGVGRSYHEDPQVPNFVLAYRGPELAEGMTIAIEPMITAGGPTSSSTTTTGRSRPSTARSRRTSSTPWRSPRRARS